MIRTKAKKTKKSNRSNNGNSNKVIIIKVPLDEGNGRLIYKMSTIYMKFFFLPFKIVSELSKETTRPGVSPLDVGRETVRNW